MSSLPLPSASQWVLDTDRDPPAYTRPLVGSELIMQRHWNRYDAGGEVCIGINFTSSLGTGELKDRARGALDKLRFVCPIIACTVEDVASPRWVYTPSADREAWLDLAFVVEDRGASLNTSEFVQAINLKRLPYTDGNGTSILFRVYLLTTSDEQYSAGKEYGLYFHGSHTIIDAGPALHALNLMCEWMSDDGMEVEIRPLEEWRNLPVDPITATGGLSKEWETLGARLLQEFAEQGARTAPCHALPPPSRPLILSDPLFRYTRTMSESETAAVVAQTKKLGVSVSVLFHAAHSLAQFKMNPIPATVSEVDFSAATTMVSLERYMKPPVYPKTHFVSSFTLMPSRFSMVRPLMERSERGKLIMAARLLQECYNKYLPDPCLPHVLAATAQAEEVPVSPWSCFFTNVGVMEGRLRTQHGDIIAVGSVSIGVRLRTIHMWTIHSKFHFQVQGDTAWGEEYTKTLLDEMIRIGFLVLDDSES